MVESEGKDEKYASPLTFPNVSGLRAEEKGKKTIVRGKQGTKVPESLQAMRKERLINEMYKYSRCRGTGTLS